jgi:hypothetical protein
MDIINPPGPVSTNQFYLLASGTVDSNALATTVLTWANNLTAATSIPMFARIRRASGTLALMIGSLRLNTTIVQPISAVQSALLGAAANPLIFALDTTTSATVIPMTGNWDFVVGTINGGASSILVEVYGCSMPA